VKRRPSRPHAQYGSPAPSGACTSVVISRVSASYFLIHQTRFSSRVVKLTDRVLVIETSDRPMPEATSSMLGSPG
jgi:hypothetical protein